MREFQKKIEDFIDEVYGDCIDAEVPKDENSLLDPTNPYAASKAACELLLRSYKVRDFHTIILVFAQSTPKSHWLF